MQQLKVIGFDAKRAAQNRTGLGGYSRFVIRGLSRHTALGRLVLYTPNPRRIEALEGTDGERAVELRFPPRGLWSRLRAFWRVWGVTLQLGADGVQLFHGLTGELPLNIRRAQGVRAVVTLHDLIFLRYPHLYKTVDRWIYTYKFRRACERADRIIAVSECTKRDLIRFFGTPAEKIEVIYQGCDEAFRRPVDAAVQEEVRVRYRLPDRFILYVGSIEERKNLLLLAEALEHLSDNGVEVIAVGRRTPYADRVQAFVDAHGLSGRFRMIEGVPFRDLPAFYRLATAFVYPSRFEGFGIPMLEALCSGTPAIGATGSCLEEAGGPSSLYVNPDDARGLAAALNRVLSDAALRSQMVAAGRAYAARFEANRLARQLTDLYERVLNGESAGRGSETQ